MSLILHNRPHPKADFPIFDPQGPNAGIAYLDSGASAQKPASVIEAVSRFYATGYANIHRGVYKLSANATDAYEGVRAQVAKFLNAPSEQEIIFVRGATEGLNLIAQSWGRTHLKAGDAVLISALEHHANIIPWQILRDQIGIELRVAALAPDGGIDRADFTAKLADGKVKLASFTHIANATGAVLPVADLTAEAKAAGALVAIDGCQAIPHRPVDVQALDCDFYVFSAHKLYGPTGIGILYGRLSVLESMPPYQTGGDMVATVRFDKTEFLEPPQRFEAGTPDIAGVIGLGAAIDYIQSLGWAWIEAQEKTLIAYGEGVLAKVPGLTLLPAGPERAGIFSFTVDGVHPHDLGTILDHHNVAIRAGSHCAQPLLNEFGLTATARASLGLYNDPEDLDRLVEAVRAAQRMFAPKRA